MQNLKKHLLYENIDQALKDQAINYINMGVSCNCLVLLSEIGILNILIKKKRISIKDLEELDNSICLKSAFVTLEKSKVLKKEGKFFYITDLGIALVEYIGLITIFFSGYGNLVLNQTKIAKNKIKEKSKLINGSSVSKAAISISEKTIDPILIQEVLKVNLSGTICDVGCGYATMLSKICKKTGNAGLGFDSESKVIKQARSKLIKTNVHLEIGDISNLQGVWNDVVILIQCHVLHDFTPNEKCVGIINSYILNFPNMRCFFYIDTVAPSISKDRIFPGFDYVHGLLGIPTRTYEETIEMFSDSMYEVVKEIRLELPNTFMWLLVPKKKESSIGPNKNRK